MPKNPRLSTDFASGEQCRLRSRIVCTLLLGLIASLALLASAEEEILVGCTAAGQLKVEVGFDQPLALPVSVYPGISGYATGDIGFHSTILDDPGNDFFQPSTEANFRLVLLARDQDMEIWNDSGSGYMAIGESYYIGQPPFDNHPIWNLTAGTPGTGYSMTLKLHDVSGVYPDSSPFVLSFTAVNQPLSYELKLNRTDFLNAMLTWPTNAAGWALETANSLTTTNWQTVTNTPAIIGTNFFLSIPTDQTRQFYRLHKYNTSLFGLDVALNDNRSHSDGRLSPIDSK